MGSEGHLRAIWGLVLEGQSEGLSGVNSEVILDPYLRNLII